MITGGGSVWLWAMTSSRGVARRYCSISRSWSETGTGVGKTAWRTSASAFCSGARGTGVLLETRGGTLLTAGVELIFGAGLGPARTGGLGNAVERLRRIAIAITIAAATPAPAQSHVNNSLRDLCCALTLARIRVSIPWRGSAFEYDASSESSISSRCWSLFCSAMFLYLQPAGEFFFEQLTRPHQPGSYCVLRNIENLRDFLRI